MKIGVILCDCNKSISEVIDYEKLEKLAQSLEGVYKVKRVSLLCKKEINVLEEFKDCDALIFAGCSEKYSLTFNEERIVKLLDKLEIDRGHFECVNLREQCAWIHSYDPEAATNKALDLLLMAYNKLKVNERAFSFNEPEKRVLVVGGGVAGIAAAMALKRMGIDADLVEKSPYIGGQGIKTFRVWQSQCYPSSCTTSCAVLTMIREASFEDFSILTNTEVEKVLREKGNFWVTLRKRPLYVDPEKCISCGKCAEVCPVEVENSFEEGIKKRKAIDKDYPTAIPDTFYVIKSVCDECGKCVEVCPSSAIDLSQKEEILERKYGGIILATGLSEKKQNLPFQADGKRIVTFLQLERLLDNRFMGTPPRRVIFYLPDGKEEPCAILNWTTAIKLINILQARMRIKCTVIYKELPTFSKTTKFFKEEAEKKGAQFIKGDIKEVIWEEKEVKVKLENGEEVSGRYLIVSQKFLPYSLEIAEKFGVLVDEDGFPVEFQPKVINPIESFAERVFVAGSLRNCNKDIQSSVESGWAAAMRAIDSLKGKNQKFYSITIQENCSKCGLCVAVCPHGAIEIREGKVFIDPAFCRGCGLCYATCPSKAIKLVNMENEQILKMAEVAFKHHNPEEGPRVLVFLCYWCSYTAADVMGYKKLDLAPNFRAIRVRCSASLDPEIVVEILNSNLADRVIVTGCPPKNCHHLWGNYMERNRFKLLERTYQDLGGGKRIFRYEYIGVSNWDKLAQIINQTCEDFEGLF